MVEQRASKKQQELLSFVDGFIRENGYGPSYREIMSALGYKSVSTVAIHIDGLIAKGYLARRDKSARSLEVVTIKPRDEGVAQKAVPVHDSTDVLLEIINKADLNDEERDVTRMVFERLGLTKVADSLRDADEVKA